MTTTVKRIKGKGTEAYVYHQLTKRVMRDLSDDYVKEYRKQAPVGETHQTRDNVHIEGADTRKTLDVVVNREDIAAILASHKGENAESNANFPVGDFIKEPLDRVKANSRETLKRAAQQLLGNG